MYDAIWDGSIGLLAIKGDICDNVDATPAAVEDDVFGVVGTGDNEWGCDDASGSVLHAIGVAGYWLADDFKLIGTLENCIPEFIWWLCWCNAANDAELCGRPFIKR